MSSRKKKLPSKMVPICPMPGYERYKMPELEHRSVNKGQYSSTFIGNLDPVAQALKIPLECLVRYYQQALSTQVKYQSGNQELHLKGTFNGDKLTEILREFIGQYVLCPTCCLPELTYQNLKKGKRLAIKCQSCGYSDNLNRPDDRIWKALLSKIPPKVKDKTELGFEKQAWQLAKHQSTDDEWCLDVSPEAISQRQQQEKGKSKILAQIMDG